MSHGSWLVVCVKGESIKVQPIGMYPMVIITVPASCLNASPVHWALHSSWLVVVVQGVVKPRKVHCRQRGHRVVTAS
jgi:hypothetical protein